ncbi:hypothetical protein CEXT_58231 [Caerostris extrusa]|uniref:Uncharacterized protein n=1 Tax=Caerostris extrusa TaxID=172846 RepID=A0AAV4MDK0_CAEEX|nr:hypothetical protein CEXT_58231 [Caerostris extrusa]
MSVAHPSTSRRLRARKIHPGQYADKRKNKNWKYWPEYAKGPVSPSDSKIAWSYWKQTTARVGKMTRRMTASLVPCLPQPQPPPPPQRRQPRPLRHPPPPPLLLPPRNRKRSTPSPSTSISTTSKGSSLERRHAPSTSDQHAYANVPMPMPMPMDMDTMKDDR